MNYPTIDADNHYYEPDDCFTRHIESRYAEAAIHLVDGRHGRTWLVGDEPISYIPSNAGDETWAPGVTAKFFAGEADSTGATLRSEDKINPHEIPGLFNRSDRLALMDEQKIEAIIQLPTLGVLFEHDMSDDPEALFANIRAFNRWLEEDWGYGQDGRIFGVPVLSMLDLDAAVAEVERVAALGAKFIYLKVGPVGDRSPADPYFDPVWARVEEVGIMPIYHVTNSGYVDWFATRWSERGNVMLPKYSAFQHLTCNIDRPAHDTFGALVLHNLFGRFPGLQVLSIENGSSWVAPLLKGMDKAARMGEFGRWIGGKVEDKPSDVFRAHCHVVPFHEDVMAPLANLIGVDRMLFGSDYPHGEGLADPNEFANRLDGLPTDDIRLIMRDNAAKLLALR